MNTSYLIKCDLYRYAASTTWGKCLKYFLKNEAFNFCFWFRMSTHEKRMVRRISKRIYKRKCRKFHIFLCPGTRIGPGLYIGHIDVGGIIVNPGTITGCNFNISPNVCIGSNTGNCAVIGDNVYIAPNVCIIEGIEIGDSVIIGAGSVLTKSVPSNSTVAGNPAKIIRENTTSTFTQNCITMLPGTNP